ncbi:hypothetical protein EVAR_28409_1 [Eumeta japonica]|uniref:Uncharacterized protein n=1 Tax=Eumeta variegata TaxID=151549 RepID=A0A4C1VAI4_EUMVA|nr:hypothetical protein EVAR_28409_1 [Eumeta japonica]
MTTGDRGTWVAITNWKLRRAKAFVLIKLAKVEDHISLSGYIQKASRTKIYSTGVDDDRSRIRSLVFPASATDRDVRSFEEAPSARGAFKYVNRPALRRKS